MAKALLLRRPGCLAAFILLGLASSTAYVEASAGDAQTIFRGCTMFCTDTCNAYPDNGAEDRAMQGFLQDPKFLGDPKLIPGDIGHFSAWQKVMQWDCPDECKYYCMWYAESHWKKRMPNHKTFQYLGKWPFERYWHIQEPMSVVFSLGNLAVVTWVFYSYYKRSTPAYGEKLHPKVQTMRSFWLCSYAFHITAWMSATLFHMRDLWLTERMDYFSACAAVTFSVTGCICMFFDFEHVKLIVVAWFVPYCIHIHYLATAPRFDYGWNMTYNIIWIVLQTIVMPFWWYRVRNDRPNAWKALAFVLILPIAAASEAMDFPPWGWLLDAHAIWHALTIPLGVMWGQFLLDDLEYMLEFNKSPHLQQ
eukprot:gene13833-33321_t